MVQPQAQQILSLAAAAGAEGEFLGHLPEPHAQAARVALGAAVLLVVVCMSMLHQHLLFPALLEQGLLVCKAAVAARVGQSLLQAEAQQTTMPLH